MRRLFFASYDKFLRPEQCTLDFGVWEGADGFPRQLRILGSTGMRRFQRTVFVQNAQDFLVRDMVEAPIVENGFDALPLGWRAALERVNHGHGDFTFAEVAGDRLAENAFGSGKIEDIVHNLEGHAKVAAIL